MAKLWPGHGAPPCGFMIGRMLTLSQSLSFLLVAISSRQPGPDNLMVLGMACPKGAGIALGLGCALGCLSHTVLAAIGVSAVVAAFASGLHAAQVDGRALPDLAGHSGTAQPGGAQMDAASKQGAVAGQLGHQGLVANAINPKVVLFFPSFLPQFVVPSQGQVACSWACCNCFSQRAGGCSFWAAGLLKFYIHRWLVDTPKARRPLAGPHRRHGVCGAGPAHDHGTLTPRHAACLGKRLSCSACCPACTDQSGLRTRSVLNTLPARRRLRPASTRWTHPGHRAGSTPHKWRPAPRRPKSAPSSARKPSIAGRAAAVQWGRRDDGVVALGD